MDQIDGGVGDMFEKIDTWLDGCVRLLPSMVLALVVLILFYFLGILIGCIVQNRAENGTAIAWATSLGHCCAGR